MIVQEKAINLKDGRAAALRTPGAADAAALLQYAKTSFGETEFLSRYPDEFAFTPEQERDWIEQSRNSPNTAPVACFVDGQLAANGQINFMPQRKTRHRATVSLAVLREYWGLGIGSALFEQFLALARQRGVEIVELAYMEGNERGRRLYEKFGFAPVGEVPRAYKLADGSYRSEVLMQKNL